MAPQEILTTRGVGQYRASEVHWGFFPTTYKPGTRRGVMFVHGSGGTPDNVRATGNKCQALAAAGYPVILCDLSAAVYSNSNWANADLISAMDAAWAYLTGTFGAKTDKVGLYGTSMGACNGLSWARVNLSTVFAAGFGCPVMDIDFCYQQVALRPFIETAYGITYPTPIVSPETRSPLDYGETDLTGLPVKLWASTNDVVASDLSVCQAWSGKGATVETVSLGAVDHNSSSVPPNDVVQFMDDNGGRG